MHQLLEEAAIYAHQAGNHITIGWVINNTGWLYWQEDHNFEQAITYLEKSLSLFQEARYQVGTNHALMRLAQLEEENGNVMQAQVRYRQTLISLENSTPNHPYLTNLLVRIASVARASGALKRTAKLLGAANRTSFEAKPDSVEYAVVDRNIVPLRIQLGETAFDEAWAEGKAMTRAEAIPSPSTTAPHLPKSPWPTPAAHQPLTDRELEIIRLLSEGLNSREIADRLILSVGTIRWYLKQIYDKLDVHSRSEAIARAKSLNILA